MSSIFSDMEIALQTKLNNIPSHPYIQWENDQVYRPAKGVRYWRPNNLPLRGELAGTQGLQKHQGIYQVDIFADAEKGLNVLMNDLDSLMTAFNTTESLYQNNTRVDILNIGRGKVVIDQSWCRTYLEIYYMCYGY